MGGKLGRIQEELNRHYAGYDDARRFQGIQLDVQLNCRFLDYDALGLC
jgi:hypothetical protein